MKIKHLNTLLLILCLFTACHPKLIPMNNSSTIVSGSGVDYAKLGASRLDIKKLLGKPSEESEDRMEYFDRGIGFYISNDRITAIFIYFISTTCKPFQGKTELGIDSNSTIKEVKKKYGKSYNVSKSIISEYGQYPGVEDYNITYNSLGITFTFYDKKLADIRIFQAR